MDLHGLVTGIGQVTRLDQLTAPVVKLVQRTLRPGTAAKDVLSGTRLGHPLHPVLTDIPIGSLTSAVVLDLLGGRRGGQAADLLVGVGLVGALPTTASGLADWSDTYGPDQRIGLVHGVANALGLTLFGASLLTRRPGRRKRRRLLGLAAMGAGGYLGGHLSYVRGVGVNHTFWRDGPETWTPVLEETGLGEGQAVEVDASGSPVLLYRADGRLDAIGARCTHAGGPLSDGEIEREGRCVRCPWHQSVFRLADGTVVHGPASVPQPAYETRVEGGKIMVRRAGRRDT